MDKETALKFTFLVNDPTFYKELQEYAEARIEILRKTLDDASLTEVDKLQGQIKELKRFRSLREEIQKAVN